MHEYDFTKEIDYEQVLSYHPAEARADELAGELFMKQRELDQERHQSKFWEKMYRDTLELFLSKI